jgi:hypothetical protein
LETLRSRLGVLDDTDLGGAQDATIELEALLLDVEDSVVLLAWLGSHEGSFVFIGVELVTFGTESLKAMLLKGLHENGFSHLDAFMEVDEVAPLLGRIRELLGGDGGQGPVEIVHAVDQVLCELLNGEVTGRLDLALCAVLQIAEVGDGAEAFVLQSEFC